MPLVLPTLDQIEDYLESVEHIVANSLSAATPDLGQVSEAVHRLWQDVLRHSPQAVPASLKGLGAFEVPPPPPPPPPPKGLWESTADWVADHPWTTAGIGIGVVGAGLLVGYASPRIHRRTRVGSRKHAAAVASAERRQVIVVLGGDSPLGLPLVLDLEKKGYIVIASVSAPEAVEPIESKCHGYVRALVLDPTEPEMIPFFLRSLASTMSRRFPLTAGDPHAPPTAHIYVHSVVSLLTLPSTSFTPAPAPLEHINLRTTYAEYLQMTHILPLQVLQALLPLLRASPARSRDALTNGLGKQSIVVCLPATDARVGLPFSGAQAMSAAATLRAVEVLRREIRAASSSRSNSETADAMGNIKVTVVDVGAVGAGMSVGDSEDLRSSVDRWTPGEQAAYGAAFGSVLEHGGLHGIRRQPSDVSVFVDTVVDVVSNGTKSHRGLSPVAISLGLGRLRELVCGDRVVVGAGAGTYAVASQLPSILLDAVLNLPYFLISIRNALLPIAPHVIAAPPPAPRRAHAPAPAAQPAVPPAKAASTSEKPAEGTDSEHNSSDNGSEADVESNEGSGSGVGESWVSLKSRSSRPAPDAA